MQRAFARSRLGHGRAQRNRPAQRFRNSGSIASAPVSGVAFVYVRDIAAFGTFQRRDLSYAHALSGGAIGRGNFACRRPRIPGHQSFLLGIAPCSWRGRTPNHRFKQTRCARCLTLSLGRLDIIHSVRVLPPNLAPAACRPETSCVHTLAFVRSRGFGAGPHFSLQRAIPDPSVTPDSHLRRRVAFSLRLDTRLRLGPTRRCSRPASTGLPRVRNIPGSALSVPTFRARG
jgi:hypothetical protein